MESWVNLSLKDENNEIWKDVVFTDHDGKFYDYTGYYKCSNKGRFKSLDRIVPNPKGKNGVGKRKGIIIKQGHHPDGYLTISFSKNSEKYIAVSHKIIGFVFIPNPLGLPEINHKRGKKKDNRVSQLEWSTPKDNSKHAFRTGLNKGSSFGKFGKDHHMSRAVEQYTLEGKYIQTFGSIREVKRITGLSTSHITECCQGLYKQSVGFIWKYAN